MQLRGACFREIQKEEESPGSLPKEAVAPIGGPGAGSEQALSTPNSERAPPTAFSPSSPASSATGLLCNPDGFCFNLYYDCIIASPLFPFYLIYPSQCCSFDSETNYFIILAFRFSPLSNSHPNSWTIMLPKAGLFCVAPCRSAATVGLS